MPTLHSESLLTEDQVINIIRVELEDQFPKDCAVCGHRFHSLKEYVLNTTQLDRPVSYDAEHQDWKPNDPMGIFSFSNCDTCNNTLTLNSSRTDVAVMHQLLGWIKKEMSQKGITNKNLIDDLRVKIETQALSEE